MVARSFISNTEGPGSGGCTESVRARRASTRDPPSVRADLGKTGIQGQGPPETPAAPSLQWSSSSTIKEPTSGAIPSGTRPGTTGVPTTGTCQDSPTAGSRSKGSQPTERSSTGTPDGRASLAGSRSWECPVWRASYQDSLHKSHYRVRQQSTDPDTATKGLRRFAKWLNGEKTGPSLKEKLLAILACL